MERTAENRDQNHANKHVGHAKGVGRMFDCPHEKFAHQCHTGCGGEQHGNRFGLAPFGDSQRFMSGVSRLSYVEMAVGTQGEEETKKRGHKQDEGDLEAEYALSLSEVG